MSDEAHDDAFSSAFHALHDIANRVASGFLQRISNLDEASAGLAQTLAAIGSAGGPGWLALLGSLIVVATILVFFGIRVGLKRLSPAATLLMRTHDMVWALLGSIAAGLLLARLMSLGPSPSRMTLSILAVAAAVACLLLSSQWMLVRALCRHRPGMPGQRVRRFVLHLNVVIGYAVAGAALLPILRAWGANAGLRDMVSTAGVGAPATFGLIAVAFINRRTIAALVGGPRPRSKRRAWTARHWPAILMAVFGLTFMASQLAQTLATPLPALAVVATLAFVIIMPLLDRVLTAWTIAGKVRENMPLARLALRLTVRPALAAIIGGLLCALWFGPLLVAQGGGFRHYSYLATTLTLLGLTASYCWNLITAASARALQQDDAAHTDEETLVPLTRFQTLAPLLAGIGRWTVATLAALSALIVVGINVWPIVTGLSVFGIAIGFGSQALVKDVVSGVFFLIDDAFRQGEYIETSGAKGVVEKISIRSVSLRHQRGALATIPYGSIGKIQNFSRDWVIEKLLFRVAIDTDVEAVRKLFKRLGQELALDPELVPDMIEPFKSQGIAELEDGTLVVRGKFKAKAGRQHLIRRKVLAAVHRAFQESGIRSVPKPLDTQLL
ncbi:MAG: mechanosensitive ion channel family protein [Bosea sp. (in: a-proteobacteria)]